MLSVSEFKNKLVNLTTQQQSKIAQTQNGENEKVVIPEEDKDAAVMLFADADDIALDFDDAIQTVKSDKETLTVYGNNRTITGSDADQQIVVIGENNKVDSKNGEDDVLVLGNNNSAKTGDGNGSVVFRGNNLNIETGKGDNRILSLDYSLIKNAEKSIETPDYSLYQNFLNVKEKTVKGEVVGKTYKTKEVSSDVKNSVTNGTASSDAFSRLTAKAKEVAQTVDFNEMVEGTDYPRYVIAQGTASGNQWHVYKYQSSSNGTASYKAYGESVSLAGDNLLKLSADSLQNNDAVISGGNVSTIKVVTQDYEVDKLADYTQYTSIGNNNIKIKSAGGNNQVYVNAERSEYKSGNGDNTLEAFSGLSFKTNEKEYEAMESSWRKYGDARENITEVDSDKIVNVYTTAARAYDPIILDFNRDGKITATQGRGVDIDGDGNADGAASKGDKMLAMSDMNKSGEIDGSEVLGDQTVSPFTKQKLNASNGFEALAKLAVEAEKYTGIACISAEGDVDLSKLQSALKTVGVDIGFISEDNVTELEGLAHVASINVARYVNVNKNNAQIQTSYYTDKSGKKYNASDVWFNS